MVFFLKIIKQNKQKKITDRNKIKMTSIQQNIDITAFYTGCPFNMTNEDLEEPEPGNYMCLGYFPVILTITEDRKYYVRPGCAAVTLEIFSNIVKRKVDKIFENCSEVKFADTDFKNMSDKEKKDFYQNDKIELLPSLVYRSEFLALKSYYEKSNEPDKESDLNRLLDFFQGIGIINPEIRNMLLDCKISNALLIYNHFKDNKKFRINVNKSCERMYKRNDCIGIISKRLDDKRILGFIFMLVSDSGIVDLIPTFNTKRQILECTRCTRKKKLNL